MRVFTLAVFCALSCFSYAQNQKPVISNVNISLAAGQVIINYSLSDVENNNCDVQLLVSNNGGQTYLLKAGTFTGDIGTGISTGSNKQITWAYDTVSNVNACKLRLVADDRQLPNIQEIVDAVDSNRLRSSLAWLSSKKRHYEANPAHLAATKDTIETRFLAAGLQTSRHNFFKDTLPGQNIVGRKPGLGKEDTTYLIDAHFDAVKDAPGADDNGSGVVGFLEALRVLAPYNFTKSIRFIGFDFEESVGGTGLAGSCSYATTQIPAWEKIVGMNNFEMIGYYSEDANAQGVPLGFNLLFPNQYAELQADSFRGNFITNVGAGNSFVFANAYDSLSAIYVPALKVITVNLPGTGGLAPDFRRSDHACFWDISVPAVMLTDGANYRNHNYHQASDDINIINFEFMTNVVKGTVATIATLAGIQHSTFYDVDAVAGIPNTTLNCDVQVYPVPVKGKLNINAGTCFTNSFSLRIMSVDGKVLMSETVTAKGNTEVATDKLAAGTYFAVLQNAQGNIVRKFVKE